MISEYDINNDVPLYGNVLTKISSNLTNSSPNCIHKNEQNCASTSLQNSIDNKIFKSTLNGLIQPFSDENKSLLMKNKNNSNISSTGIPELDSNASEHHNNYVNGVGGEINNSKYNHCSTNVETDNSVSHLPTVDNIKNDVISSNKLKLPSDNGESKCSVLSHIYKLNLPDKQYCDELTEKVDNVVSPVELNGESVSNPVMVCNTEIKIDLNEGSNHDNSKCTTVLDDETTTLKVQFHDSDRLIEEKSTVEGTCIGMDKIIVKNDQELVNINSSTPSNFLISFESSESQNSNNSNSKISHQNSHNNNKVESINNDNISEQQSKSYSFNEPVLLNDKSTDGKPSHSSNEKINDISSDTKKESKLLKLTPEIEKNNLSNDKNYLETINNSVSDGVNESKISLEDGNKPDKREDTCKKTERLSKEERASGLKRSLDSDSETEKKVKRVKYSTVQKKNLDSPSTSQTVNNESETSKVFNPSTNNFMKECCDSSLEQEGETNPNKLYLGLLNDVIAEEKDLIKEPEGVRTKLQRIKRKELEDIIIDQLMNKILYDHELGYQKELCKRLEHTLEAANKRALRLTQEVESLRNITNKVSAEHKRRKMFLVHPTKIKRSVGIQANKTYISQGYSATVTPDSEVRIVVPTKYQRVKKVSEKSEKNSSLKTRGKSKAKNQLKEIKVEKEEDKDYLGISRKLEQKLNTLREDMENPSQDNFSYPYTKKSKQGKYQSVNGKKIKTEKPDILTPISSPVKSEDAKLICPAPLPHMSYSDDDLRLGRVPPSPTLKVHLRNKSIILSWNIITSYDETSILSYQLYSYEESKDPPSTDLWQKIGSVKALELPMACTLTQFKCGRTYHFAVRAMSKKGRLGPFSIPKSLRMPPK